MKSVVRRVQSEAPEGVMGPAEGAIAPIAPALLPAWRLADLMSDL